MTTEHQSGARGAHSTDGIVHVANAPVSYGAFELTVGIDPNVPSADGVLDAIAGAGYEGVDLGPVGYFGKGAELDQALGSRGLKLAGGYLEVDVTTPEGAEQGVADLEALMQCFDAVSAVVPQHLRPRPTIALIGPGVAPGDRAEHEASLWENAERVMARLCETSRGRGYEPCLHNELGTLVTTSEDLDRAMGFSDMSLCLDSGHFFVGGGDPLAALRKWGSRTYQVHIKDAHLEPYRLIVAEGRPVSDIWSDGAFCRLGDGEAGARELVEALVTSGYSGWLVVEQDTFPKGTAGYETAARDQEANRRFLSQFGV
jgi:inosose dehydratase